MSDIPSIYYGDAEYHANLYFVKLRSNYRPEFSPFHYKSTPAYKNEENIIAQLSRPVSDICSRYPGQLYDNGITVKSHYEEFNSLTLKFNRIYSSREKLPDDLQLEHNVHFEETKMYYAKIDSTRYEILQGDSNIQEVYIPSYEILRYFYFRTDRLITDFIDNSYNFEGIEHGFIDEEKSIFSIHSRLNYKPNEFIVLASILSTESRFEHYERFRNSLFSDYLSREGIGIFFTYLPIDINKIELVGRKVYKDGKVSFVACHIKNSVFDFAFDELIFDSDQDGRFGTNRNDPNLKKVKRPRKKTSENEDENHDQEHQNNVPPIEFDEVVDEYPVPNFRRLEKGEQKMRVISTIIKTNTNGYSGRIQGGGDEDLPSGMKVNLGNVENTEQLFNNIELLGDLIIELSNNFNVKPIVGIGGKFTNEDLSDPNRTYLNLFNSIPFENNFELNPKQQKFCKYYKQQRNKWSGRRGVLIAQITSQTFKTCNLVEIEPKLRKGSVDRFTCLIIHNKNGLEVGNDILRKVLMLSAICEGVWKHVVEKLIEVGVEVKIIKHEKDFINKVVEVCRDIID